MSQHIQTNKKKLKKLELPYCASRIEKLGKKEYHPVPIIIVKELTDVPKDIKAIFVASKSSILKAPYFEKDGHVFFCGKAQMRSSSVTSRNAARTMAKIYAEGNVVKLVATKISYKGTILEGRAKLQEVFFNKWQTIPSAQEAISKGLKPIYEVLDGKTVYYVLATENPDNLFCNGVPPTFEQMRKSVIEMPKRNELLVYEILDEKQLRGQLEQIAKNLDENVNPNFSLMFQGKPPRPVTEEKQKRGRDLLALMTSSASLDDLLDLTAFLPYDKELCKRLIEKLNALEMTRCSALLAQRLAEYPKIKAAEEQRLKDLAEKNVERVAVQAPAPAPQAEKASIDTPATEAESAKPPRQN